MKDLIAEIAAVLEAWSPSDESANNAAKRIWELVARDRIDYAHARADHGQLAGQDSTADPRCFGANTQRSMGQ